MLQQGAVAVGWLAIFNAIGRIAWGWISDRAGRTIAFVVMFLTQAIMLSLLVQAESPVSLTIAASIIGFNFGGNFALFPSTTADLFGAENLGANYGWVSTAYGMAGVAGIVGLNKAIDQTGSYGPAFTIAAAMCVLSAALAIALRRYAKGHET